MLYKTITNTVTMQDAVKAELRRRKKSWYWLSQQVVRHNPSRKQITTQSNIYRWIEGVSDTRSRLIQEILQALDLTVTRINN